MVASFISLIKNEFFFKGEDDNQLFSELGHEAVSCFYKRLVNRATTSDEVPTTHADSEPPVLDAQVGESSVPSPDLGLKLGARQRVSPNSSKLIPLVLELS